MTLVTEHSLDQSFPIVAKHLRISAAPAHPLVPGLAEKHGLFIIEDGFLTKGNFYSLCDLVNTELYIFGEQVIWPAVYLISDLSTEKETGSGHGTAEMDDISGMIEISAFS